MLCQESPSSVVCVVCFFVCLFVCLCVCLSVSHLSEGDLWRTRAWCLPVPHIGQRRQ